MREPASTDSLIASLAQGVAPVRRLRPPAMRGLAWIALAAVVIAVLASWRGLRADIGLQMADPAYWVQLLGAALTGICATFAVFEVSLPDRPRLWILLPAPAALFWATGFAYGCLGHWIAIPFGAPVLEDSERCLTTIVLATIPLGLVLWLMLRRTHSLRPSDSAWLGALAVAGFADTAHLLLHTVQASLLVLAVNVLPVAVIVIAGGLGGGRNLRLKTGG
jgi:hypothetical protein